MEAAFLHTLAAVVPMFPRQWVLSVADSLGWLAYWVLPRDRRVADANAEVVFGDTKTAAQKRRIAKRGPRTRARNLAGLFWARRPARDNIRRYVEVDDDNWRWFEGVRARGRGVIVITPHYGDWEM